MNDDLQLGDVVGRPLLPERIEDREHVGVLKYDSLVPIETFLDNPGAPAASGDEEGEGGVDGERVVTRGELRGQRPQVSEGIIGFGSGDGERGVEEEEEESEEEGGAGHVGQKRGTAVSAVSGH